MLLSVLLPSQLAGTLVVVVWAALENLMGERLILFVRLPATLGKRHSHTSAAPS